MVASELLEYLLRNRLTLSQASKDSIIFEQSLITKEFMIRRKQRWNLSLLLCNSSFLKSSILDRELFDIMFNELNSYPVDGDYNALFNLPFVTREFINSHIDQWPLTSRNFIDAIISRISQLLQYRIILMDILTYKAGIITELIRALLLSPLMNKEFFNEYQLYNYPDELAELVETFNLPFMNEQLFDKIFTYFPLSLYHNEGLFKSNIFTKEFFDQYHNRWNWQQLSSSEYFFSVSFMTEGFFLTYFNQYSQKRLSRNIHFFNAPFMTEEFFCNCVDIFNWRWLSRSKVIFNSKIMTVTVFSHGKWNWNTLSGSTALFTSKLMNSEFFINYNNKWNMNIIRKNLLCPDLFNRYTSNCSPAVFATR